jgi:hypothetical protein
MRLLSLTVLVGVSIVAVACGGRPQGQPQAAYRPTATVKDIMDSIVDPDADVLWNSVATIVTLTGTEEREPKTDEEWTAVRRSAIKLVEATNLLMMPGRRVARTGEKSENPHVELEPAAIEKLITDDPVTWSKLVTGLHDAAVPALNAINEKNAKDLFEAGDSLDKACESCHQHYWYPPKSAQAWKVNEAIVPSSVPVPVPTPTASGHGTIRGHVRVTGTVPGNPVIRMGMDPMCAGLNAGKRTVQEAVAAGADGSLANVFVTLRGSFPPVPVPDEPVVIDQRACLYVPRVVGARVGQILQVRNSDDFLHNVHSQSNHGNAFNFGEPKAGIVQQIRLKDEEIMLPVACDVHRWMTAYVGVVSHPYFSTTGSAGNYIMERVPSGTYTMQTWHERFGTLTQTVRVTDGAAAAVDFAYSGSEKR